MPNFFINNLGKLWAVILLLVAGFLLPKNGSWIIDDGIKRIAVEQSADAWSAKVIDGPIRSSLSNPDKFIPVNPPFAERVEDGFRPGFSPLTRVWFKIMHQAGDLIYRIWPALIAVLFWWVCETVGIKFAFLLLPLTFYGLVEWEHGLSWLLLWPSIWLILGIEKFSYLQLFGSSLALSVAVLFRPETAILALSLSGYLLLKKQLKAWLIFSGSVLLGIAIFLITHFATSSQPAWIQISLNQIKRAHELNLWQWFGEKGSAFYTLILQMDQAWIISLTYLLIFLAAGHLLHWGEHKQKKLWLFCGITLYLLWFSALAYDLWSHPLPALELTRQNSLLVSLPWVFAMLIPPYKNRPALLLFVIVVLAAVVTTPIWEGVHWGPRLLLFAVPLLLADLYHTLKYRSWLFKTLLGLTFLQTVNSAVLVYARSQEMADRVKYSEPILQNPAVCASMYQAADLAKLWNGREFFVVNNSRELRQLALEFYEMKLDSFSLHLAAGDPLYINAFPKEGPVRPLKMTLINAGSLYKTKWRIYRLAMNRSDSLWSEVMQIEAKDLMEGKDFESALKWQKQAVILNEKSAKTHFNLALILGGMGRENEAVEELLAALSYDNNFTPAIELLQKLKIGQ